MIFYDTTGSAGLLPPYDDEQATFVRHLGAEKSGLNKAGTCVGGAYS